MYVFAATFLTPVNNANGVKLSFEVENENRNMLESENSSLTNMPMGKHFLVVAYEIGEDSEEIATAYKSKDGAKNINMRRIHAVIEEYSIDTGLSAAKIKDILRATLKSRKKIEKSLSELDEHSSAEAVFLLQTLLHPSRFNYNEYDKEDK